jgi:hypothetical protein
MEIISYSSKGGLEDKTGLYKRELAGSRVELWIR